MQMTDNTRRLIDR